MYLSASLFALMLSPVWLVSATWPADLSLPHQNPLTPLRVAEGCNCTGIEKSTTNNSYYICNNATLGPQVLPWRLPLLSLVSDYDRFGSLTPVEFLHRWYDPALSRWKFPASDGFQLDTDGRPINGTMVLRAGSKVDRFGDETGRFVASADATFAQRALPPDSLNVCKNASLPCEPKAYPWSYHIYNVTCDFRVSGGPIAAAFGQPGGGMQYRLPTRVSDLVANGTLVPLTFSDVRPGPGTDGKCGWKPANCTCERPKY